MGSPTQFGDVLFGEVLWGETPGSNNLPPIEENINMARPKAVTSPMVASAFTVDPGSVASVTGLDVTVTIKGLRLNYPVHVWAPSLEDNLAICNAHCSAANTLKFRLVNPTAGAIDPASQTMYCVQR